ncbi:NADPH-dependent FMN reductase [Phenylobacterium sp.]|uniref:NADPH-dependent FMN reductase n=1 Tax=Phenylobacterium sp. TaxID=1871053 RepID=UPI0035B1B297
MRILAISGSLRAASSNSRLIEALPRLAPAGVEVVIWRGLEGLPYFNPDLDVDPPPAPVAELRRQIGLAQGLVICSPEYAHGVSGAMKNALDWLVSSLEFPAIPLALINAAPRAVHAIAHLRETLATMSAAFVEEACVTVPLQGRDLTAADIPGAPGIGDVLTDAMARFCKALPALQAERLFGNGA